MQVAIVIPSWNGADLLRECLPSVIAAAQACDFACRVYVVDDASSDDTATLVHQQFPQAEYLHLSERVGFGRACWAGVMASSSDVIVLLNNDVWVEVTAIQHLIRPHFDVRPSLFATGAHVLSWDRQSIYSARIACAFQQGTFRFSICSQEPSEQSIPRPTLYAGGGMGAFRRDTFIQLKGFDSLYEPFYFEDVDLSYRAWKQGGEILYVPSSLMIHKHSATIRRHFDPSYVKTIKIRNYLLFTWKNIADTRWRLQHAGYLSVRILKSIVRQDRIWLQAFVEAYRLRSCAKPHRGQYGQIATRSDREVFRLVNALNLEADANG